MSYYYNIVVQCSVSVVPYYCATDEINNRLRWDTCLTAVIDTHRPIVQIQNGRAHSWWVRVHYYVILIFNMNDIMTHAAIEIFCLSVHIIITSINGQCVESLRLRKRKKRKRCEKKKEKNRKQFMASEIWDYFRLCGWYNIRVNII